MKNPAAKSVSPNKTISILAKRNPNYDFSQSKYQDDFTPITFRCKKFGHICRSLLCALLRGKYECNKCRFTRKPEVKSLVKPKEYYVAKAISKHGNRFKYHRVTYHKNIDTPISIYCTECNSWIITTWYRHITYGCICDKGKSARLYNKKIVDKNIENFEKAKLKNPGFVVLGSYTGFLDKVELSCRLCGTLKKVGQQYFIHNKQTCDKCNSPWDAAILRNSTFEVILLSSNRVKLTCTTCLFSREISRDNFLYTKHQKCIKCNPKLHGKLQEQVTSEIEKSVRLNFIREFKIKDGKFRASLDGYNKRYNIAFEFHGDTWHGNLNKFKPRSYPNYTSSLTAYKLNKQTKTRENKIISLGYNLIVVWESEWKTDLRATIKRVKREIREIKIAKNSIKGFR